MSFLDRNTLLKKRPRRTKIVVFAADHPDADLAGRKVIVQALTARERAEFEMQFSDKRGKPVAARQAEIRERLVIATAVNEAGELLFSADDLPALKEVDAAILEAIVKASQELNEISDEDLESLEKKPPTPPAKSPGK